MSLFWLDRWSLPSSVCTSAIGTGAVSFHSAKCSASALIVPTRASSIARRDDELVRVEETLRTLILIDFTGCLALIRVATQLVDRCRYRLRRSWALALNNDYRESR